MGGLANASDLLIEPNDEISPELTLSDRAAGSTEETSVADLPLWYSVLVSRPSWDEAAETAESETLSRLFWRVSVGRWPIERRQRWGNRANELQDAGLDWKEAERVAFEEIMDGLKRPNH
jgi:hypothetical protein